VDDANAFGIEFMELLNSKGPTIFIVKVDPDQIFYPKILSSKNELGEIVSNPLHLMEPPLSDADFKKFAPNLVR
jgi:hypothetical protein